MPTWAARDLGYERVRLDAGPSSVTAAPSSQRRATSRSRPTTETTSRTTGPRSRSSVRVLDRAQRDRPVRAHAPPGRRALTHDAPVAIEEQEAPAAAAVALAQVTEAACLHAVLGRLVVHADDVQHPPERRGAGERDRRPRPARDSTRRDH